MSDKIKTIIIVCIEAPDAKLPPVLNITRIANELGYKVVLVTSKIHPLEKKSLHDIGIEYFELFGNKINPDKKSKLKIYDKAKTYLTWLIFRARAWKVIKNFNKFSPLVWIGSIDTAIALGKNLHRHHFIFHSHELLDCAPIRRRFARHYSLLAKCVVVPSDFRAEIIQAWFKLKGKPTVLPNKTYSHPRVRCAFIKTDINPDIAAILKNKKVVLYQGVIHRSRPLHHIAEAIYTLGENWHLVIMGNILDDSLCFIQKRYTNISVLPHIHAPHHLDITSYAHIGIVTYEGSSLNNIFCAPNKIWEYAGFGIPMLCSDIAGLRYTIGMNGAGICTNIDDTNQIMASLIKIDDNYKLYSTNASNFFNSTDERAIVKKILLSNNAS